MNLTTTKNNLTSLEVLEQINIFRKEESDRAELRHDTLRNIIKNEFEEEILSQNILEKSISSNGGRPTKVFILTLSQAKQILLRESKFVRKAVIHYIEQLESKLTIPTTFKEALKLALQQQEQIEELALQNKNKDLKLEIQAPKVEYHDKVLNINSLITTTKIAKDLSMSARKLNEELHNKGIIYKHTNTWLFYSEYQHMIPEYADYHITEYGQQLKWTEKGRQWIIKLLNKEEMM